MRKVDENRAENYIRKHEKHKKWLSFVLCLSLLTGTLTLYMLNKPATAMTEDGSKALGVVLDTNDSEFEEKLIEETINNDEDSKEEEKSEENDQEEAEEEKKEESTEGGSEETETEEKTEAADEEETEEETDKDEADKEVDDTDSDKEETEEDSDKEETEEGTAEEKTEDEDTDKDSEDKDTDKDTEEEDTDETSDEEKDEESLDKKDKDQEESEEEEDDKDSKLKKGDKEESEDDEEDTDKKDKKDSKSKKSEDDELEEDVVIAVSYVDENGESLKDDKEISISDSISFADEAPSIEGYEFKEATLDGDVITALSVKKNDDDIRYYEVTFSDDSTEDITEDKTVVLTYTLLEEEAAEEIVITASYVDEDGDSIQEESELKIDGSVTFEKDAPEIEGYTFKKASLGDDVITKIEVKETEDEAVCYEATLEDESTKEITESSTVVFTYVVNEELTKGVVLTASYINEEGESIKEDKNLVITDSITFKDDATEIEGYEFKQATIDDSVVTKITVVKSDDAEDASEDSKEDDKEDAAEGAKYYEATLEDGSTIEIKEDKTVVLTYAVSETKASLVLTALYVDRAGEEIAESKELKINEEKEASELEPEEIDGFFYQGLFYEEDEIVKITPVIEEKTDKKSDDKDAESDKTDENSEEKADSDEEDADLIIGYKLETAEGKTVELNEDAEVKFTFLKASQETEFTFSDDKVNIKVVTNKKNVFPEGVELKGAEVTSKSEKYNYDAYMEALNENAEAIAEEAGKESAERLSKSNTLLYDIAFIFEGKEIQPKDGSVTVTIEFKEQQLTENLAAANKDDVAVVHLPIKEEVKESAEITTTEEATDITKEDIEIETLVEATAEVDKEEKVEFTSETFSIFAVITYQDHTPGTDTFKSVLGDAVNFGVITDAFYVGESETNFAAKTVYANAQTGNDMTNPVEQTFIAANVVTDAAPELKIKGEKAFFIVPSGLETKIRHEKDRKDENNNTVNNNIIFDTSHTREQLEDIVKALLDYTRAASADLAKRKDNAIIEEDKNDSSRLMVDLTGSEYDANGTYYVTVTDDKEHEYDRSNLERIAEDQQLYIYKKSGQTIVFNVPQAGEIKLGKYMVSTDGGQAVGSDTMAGIKQDPVTRTIIWNFQNATSVQTGGGVAGVFISGTTNATWNNNNTSSGWIAFPAVKIGAEFHNTYDEIQQISGTAQLQAYKTIDGEKATVSGFKFKLAIQNGTWRDLQEITNSEDAPYNITFDSITFGDDANYTGTGLYQYVGINVDESKDFIFNIDETQGTTDSEGNAYTEDTNFYFAKVTVTKKKLNDFTNTTYYQVSEPKYYNNYEDCKNNRNPISDRPVFDNTTQKGKVGIKLYKYLNNEDPGEHEFSFTVRKFKPTGIVTDTLGTHSSGYLETVNSNLKNDGKIISFDFDYNSQDIATDIHGGKHIYLVITENNNTSTINGITVKNDTDYILVRIDIPANGVKSEDQLKVNYYKVSAENVNVSRIEDETVTDKFVYVSAICNGSAGFYIDPADYDKKLAFFNTAQAMLRIHKMVVNDFGSDFVRDNVNSILNSVQFRITNNTTRNFILLRGFADKEGKTSMDHWGENAFEYDAVTKKKTGREFEVVCNGNAQWTIIGLDAGTYTVEEVQDGFTFDYYLDSNQSVVRMDTPYSRVTMYGLTTDDEEVGLTDYGVGGENWRKVFSADVTEVTALGEKGPTNVKVGDLSVGNTSHTQTVQVCNYYSKPIGPIQVTKNLIGGNLTEPTEFVFTIKPAGFTIKDSAGNDVVLPSGEGAYQQPMPIKTVVINEETGETKTEVEPQARVTLDSENSTGIAEFESIPFRFEGTYYYTITEDVPENTSGIKYDTRTYYVEVVVEKKYTQFIKDYTYEKGMTHPAKYTAYTKIDNEDFYYLGANVRYATDENFSNVVAGCELYLGYNPTTNKPDVKEFQIKYTEGTGVSDVAFNNERTGELTIIKKWMDYEGNLDPDSYDLIDTFELAPEKHTSLKLTILQRPEGTNEWHEYKTITMTSEQLQEDKTWKYTEKDVPVLNEQRQKLEYCVKEPDEYMAIYTIEYSYKNGQTTQTYNATASNNNPTYVMSFEGNSFGEVTITNTPKEMNKLPETGSIGTTPWLVLGALLSVLSIIGLMFFRKRKTT